MYLRSLSRIEAFVVLILQLKCNFTFLLTSYYLMYIYFMLYNRLHNTI